MIKLVCQWTPNHLLLEYHCTWIIINEPLLYSKFLTCMIIDKCLTCYNRLYSDPLPYHLHLLGILLLESALCIILLSVVVVWCHNLHTNHLPGASLRDPWSTACSIHFSHLLKCKYMIVWWWLIIRSYVHATCKPLYSHSYSCFLLLSKFFSLHWWRGWKQAVSIKDTIIM